MAGKIVRRTTAVSQLLRGRIVGFSPRRCDTLHGEGESVDLPHQISQTTVMGGGTGPRQT